MSKKQSVKINEDLLKHLHQSGLKHEITQVLRALEVTIHHAIDNNKAIESCPFDEIRCCLDFLHSENHKVSSAPHKKRKEPVVLMPGHH